MEKQLTNASLELGNGYIESACKAFGVGRGVYYRAIQRKKAGLRLSKNQIDVLAKYQELTEEAKEKLGGLK